MLNYILNIKHSHCQTFVSSYEQQASSSVEFDNDCEVIIMFKFKVFWHHL